MKRISSKSDGAASHPSPPSKKPVALDDDATPQVRRFEVLYGQARARKNKRWEFDGFLVCYNRDARLIDTSNDVNVKLSSALSLKQIRDLQPGSTVILGNIECQIQREIDSNESADCDRSESSFQTASAALQCEKERPFSPAPLASHQPSCNFAPREFRKTSDASISSSASSNLLKMPFSVPTQSTDNNEATNGESAGDLPVVPFKLADFLRDQMREYQIDGVNAMFDKLKHPNTGFILGDEMGLGKTLQTIALLHTMLHTKVQARSLVVKALIICPLGLMQNWCDEFQKWISRKMICFLARADFDVNQYTAIFHRQPVLIMNYDMIIARAGALKNIQFDIVVCDEAHRLKNRGKVFAALQQLRCSRRLLITGTPIQNRIREFYNLYKFIRPADNILLPEFSDRLEKDGKEFYNEFLLRRTSDVAGCCLPKMTQFLVFCVPSALQRETYTACTELAGIESLALISYLRACCAHPVLLRDSIQQKDIPDGAQILQHFPESFKLTLSQSTKCVVTMNLVLAFCGLGEKTIIVSAFTKVLDFLDSAVRSASITPLRIDGSMNTDARNAVVKRFNRPKSSEKVLLLSVNAGGCGLNLTGANRLILFDSSWNPATDRQAMGRIYRLGQDKPCYVYQLATTGTIEEKILQYQIVKSQMAAVFDEKNKEGDDIGEIIDNDSDIFAYSEPTGCYIHELIGCQCRGDGTNVQSPENAEENETPDPPEDQNKRILIDELDNWLHFEACHLIDIMPESHICDAGLSSISYVMHSP